MNGTDVNETRTKSTSRAFAEEIATEIEAICGAARGISAVVDLFLNTDMMGIGGNRLVKAACIPRECPMQRYARGCVRKSPSVTVVVQARADDLNGREPEEFCAVAEEIASALVATGTVGYFTITEAVSNGTFIKEHFETAGVISVPITVTGEITEDIVTFGTGRTTR